MASVPDREKLEALRSWFLEHGGFLHDDAELAVGPDGIFMRNGHRGGPVKFEPVVRTPRDLIISHRTAEVSPLLSSLTGRVERHVMAYFALLEEVHRGSQSKWAPYIQCLPQHGEDIATPLHFSKAQNKWLLGTNVLDAMQELLRLREIEFDRAIGVLRSQPDGESRVPATFRLERYLWAATIFSSRSFASANQETEGDSDPTLCPVADLLNHYHAAKVAWDFLPNGDFCISTDDALAPGKEIFNNYGPKSNEQLLLGYGFSLLGNPHDSVAIRLGKPPSPVHARIKLLYPHIFRADNWPLKESLFYILERDHGYDETRAYPDFDPKIARYVKSVPDHLFRLLFELACFAISGPERYDASSHPDCRSIPSVFRRILAQLRGKFGKIREHDAYLENRTPETRQERNAAIYRNSQKAILQRSISDLTLLLRLFILQEDTVQKPSCISILCLQEILESQKTEDADFHHQFVAGIEAAFGTSDIDAVREAGGEDLVWSLWLVHMLQISKGCRNLPHEPWMRRLFRGLLKPYPVDRAPRADPDFLDDLKSCAHSACQGVQEQAQLYWENLASTADQEFAWSQWVMSNETFEDRMVLGHDALCIAFHDDHAEEHLLKRP